METARAVDQNRQQPAAAAQILRRAAVGEADTLLEAEAAALLPAAVVIPLEEITAAITKKATADC